MDTLITMGIVTAAMLFFVGNYVRNLLAKEVVARQAAEKGMLFSEGPRGLHPRIDTGDCIGCGTCTAVCPEGDVLAMVDGKPAIVNGHSCIGHGICAEACPVGAITLVMASPGVGADLPYLTSEYETSIQNLFIAGELGGLALIKNAINQGRECVDTIAGRLATRSVIPNVYDVLIVGAGPAGISASLRAIEKGLHYLTVEQDEPGGAVAKFPRQKLVMTSPVELPLYGRFKKTELTKEHLLAFWDMVLNRADFNVWTDSRVEDIRKGPDGIFIVVTATNQYRAQSVVLAIGRSGNPKKLGVKGEELPKVMYRLTSADQYTNNRILVVGGGDSAVEAAMGLAQQSGNQVTLSYRKERFFRINERNANRIEESMNGRKISVLFNSVPVEFTRESVVLNVRGRLRKLANDYTWIFAGGDPPNAFLKKIGVELSVRDMIHSQEHRAGRANDPPGMVSGVRSRSSARTPHL